MVAAILEAAAELFASQGYARATTNRIAERAGVSVGSLYQYFPNKDSLLASLLTQHHAEVHDVVDVAMARLADPREPLEDCLRKLLHDLVGVHRANPTLTQALSPAVMRESTARDELHKIEDDAARARQVVTLLAARPDVREGNHGAMALVLGQTLSSLTPWLVHDAPADADLDMLTEELLQLVVRYLKAR